MTASAAHPLWVVHPEIVMNTLLPGRRRNGDILGLSLEESDALLDELRAHATRAGFSFCQQRKVGDLILWDKRATLHRRESFDAVSRRRMHSALIKGGALKAAA